MGQIGNQQLSHLSLRKIEKVSLSDIIKEESTRIFKYKVFHKWAESEGLKDQALRQAIGELQNGLFEANSGSGLYKKRVAIAGKGKSGGYRTLLAFKNEEKAFFDLWVCQK